jgi:hypothetical protein
MPCIFGQESLTIALQYSANQEHMMTRVAVIQPSYIPWRGYFDMIQQVDLFVFYDDVKYTKQDWRNRNRIKTRYGLQWLTVPVNSDATKCNINEVLIANEKAWGDHHWRVLQMEYGDAPFFSQYTDFFKEVYTRQWDKLAELDCYLTIEICKFLAIKAEFVQSSAYQSQGHSTAKLIDLLQKVGATYYLSGPAARNYIDVTLFNQAHIELEYVKYDYLQYPQLHGDFEPQVSVIDLLFNVGADASKYIRG